MFENSKYRLKIKNKMYNDELPFYSQKCDNSAKFSLK